mmetsp:Transcript_34635/g.81547  ORF Transcript_34635/g.81547 Transcript_34635/m.81547 type:complete len:200 (+) Transcript_34635:226-825(+)
MVLRRLLGGGCLLCRHLGEDADRPHTALVSTAIGVIGGGDAVAEIRLFEAFDNDFLPSRRTPPSVVAEDRGGAAVVEGGVDEEEREDPDSSAEKAFFLAESAHEAELLARHSLLRCLFPRRKGESVSILAPAFLFLHPDLVPHSPRRHLLPVLIVHRFGSLFDVFYEIINSNGPQPCRQSRGDERRCCCISCLLLIFSS